MESVRDNEREKFIRSAAPFLAPLRGRSFRSERIPGFQVTFLSADEAEPRTGWYLSEDGGVTRVLKGLAAMKAATALLIEPVTTTSP